MRTIVRRTVDWLCHRFFWVSFAMTLSGLALAFVSFYWRIQHTHPLINLTGLLLIAVVPWLLGTALVVTKNVKKEVVYFNDIQYPSLVWVICGAPYALYFAVASGYISAKQAPWALLVAIIVLGCQYLLVRPRQVSPTR